jgi:hypothetical protein
LEAKPRNCRLLAYVTNAYGISAAVAALPLPALQAIQLTVDEPCIAAVARFARTGAAAVAVVESFHFAATAIGVFDWDVFRRDRDRMDDATVR